MMMTIRRMKAEIRALRAKVKDRDQTIAELDRKLIEKGQIIRQLCEHP